MNSSNLRNDARVAFLTARSYLKAKRRSRSATSAFAAAMLDFELGRDRLCVDIVQQAMAQLTSRGSAVHRSSSACKPNCSALVWDLRSSISFHASQYGCRMQRWVANSWHPFECLVLSVECS